MPIEDIKHCIYCGNTFEDFEKVLQHVRKEHRDQDEHDAFLPIEGGTIHDDK